MDKKVLIELTTEIVSSHAAVNEMSREDLLDEIQAVFQRLNVLAGEEAAVEGEVVPESKPAVSMDKAVGADKVFCMVCGKGFTTLKKHLAISHNLTPKDYRKKFNIPGKLPLVAKNYSDQKKKIAQKLGLAEKLAAGRKKKKGN